MKFEDRVDAGKQLAKLLEKYREEKPIILGLPRGGIVLAYEISQHLGAELDVIVSRKIGAPGQPEFAVGAIAYGDVVILDETVLMQLGIEKSTVEALIEKEKKELQRRIHVFRGENPFPEIEGRVVILVDDGLATGRTVVAAVHSMKKLKPKKIILAVGVSSTEARKNIEKEVDEIISVLTPANLNAVGEFYENFKQVTDEEVLALLEKK